MGTESQSIITSITNPETGGKLTVIQKKSMVASTIGHILAIPRYVIMSRPADFLKEPSDTLAQQLTERWQDVPWKGEVTVRIGHADAREEWNIARQTLKDQGKLTPFTEALVKAHIYMSAWKTNLFRGNNFYSLTGTVHLMRDNLATGMHELGHAEDLMGKSRDKGGFMGMLERERRASHNAMRHFKDDVERKKAMKVLEPAYTSYLMAPLQLLATLSRLEMRLAKPLYKYTVKVGKYDIPPAMFLPLTQMAGVGISKLIARLPGRNSSFGYIFEGKPGEAYLKPHQVRYAQAKAI